MFHVLHIDDEPDLLEVSQLYLERSGQLRLTTESSPMAALRLLAQKEFDAVICDYRMPELSGLEVLRQLRLAGSRIPFIIFTGNSREEVAIEALNQGANFYLQKRGEPRAQFSELENTVRRAVEQHRAERETRAGQLLPLDSESMRSALLETTDTGYVILDERSLVVDANASYLQLTGRSDLDSVLGHSVMEWTAPHDQERNSSEVERCLSGQIIRSLEIDYLRSDGSLVPIEINARAVQTPQGPRILALCRDISERRQADLLRKSNERLQDSEAPYHNLVDNAAGVIFSLSSSGVVTFISPAVEHLIGFPPEEIIGKHISQFVFPADRESLLDKFKRTLAGELGLAEYRLVNQDGRPIWVQSYSQLLRSGDQVTGTTGILVDINQRKLATELAEETEDRYRRLLQLSFDAVLAARDGRLVLANKAAATLLGAGDPEQLLGLPLSQFIAPSPAGELHRELDGQVTLDLTLATREAQFARLDGTLLDVEVVAASLPLQGEPAVHLVFRDISQRKRSERALEAAHRKLQLLSSCSRHDLQNSVMTLQGYLDMVTNIINQEDPDLSRWMAGVNRGVRAILATLELMRQYETVAGREPEWLPAALTTRRVAATFAGVTIEIDLPEELEVFVDPGLDRVFHNLFDNALKHGVSVSQIQVRLASGRGGLCILVTDDGCGVLPDQKERIFERGVGRHTGLGLFLVRQILGLTGVEIGECGEPGKGACFELRFPAASYRYRAPRPGRQ